MSGIASQLKPPCRLHAGKRDLQTKEAYMKTILCILAVLVLTASTADAYVRRTVGGGYVVRGAGAHSGRYAGGYYGRGYYGHPVARGAALAAGTALVAVTAWGWNQPYYGGGYPYSYGGYGAYSYGAYSYGGYPYSYSGYPYSYTGSPFGYGGFPYSHGWSDDY